MAFEISVEPEVDVPVGVTALLQQAAVMTLKHQGVADTAALTILLADDETLHSLNRDFLDEDRPTDVLSFPAGELMPGIGELAAEFADDLAHYLGDIALSVPYATRQATAKGHEPAAEMQLLVVHGVLHLLGYDHATPVEQAQMWRVQAEILEQLGLRGIAPTDELDEERPSG
jgi:probable rRNA maturation factor